MKITANIKFASGKQKIESFGSSRYLVYLILEKDNPKAMDEFVILMSKELTVPSSRICYKGKQGESYIFDVD